MNSWTAAKTSLKRAYVDITLVAAMEERLTFEHEETKS